MDRKTGQRGLAWLLVGIIAACGGGDGEGGNASQDSGDSAEEEVATVIPGDLIPLRVGSHEIQVEIADDDDERSRGLMHRQSLPPDQGMLFVYPSPRRLSFWMKNTLIPLDIAFIDTEGRIVDIQQMEPQSEEFHVSSQPALWALEMNEGWFAAHGVQVGERVEF